MKALKAEQSWDHSEIELTANISIYWYFVLTISLLLLIGTEYAEPKEAAEKMAPYLIWITVITFTLSTQRTIILWDKNTKIALLKKSILGFSRTIHIGFDKISLDVEFINANNLSPNEKGIDADWFVLKMSKKKYLLHSEVPAIKKNILIMKEKLGLTETKI